MKILIVSINYSPEHTGTAPYVEGIAQKLADKHEVTVLSGLPHYPQWRVQREWRHWRRESTEKGVKVIRVAHYVPHRQDAVRRAAYELTWAAHALLEARRVETDVVVAFVPALLTAQVAVVLSRLKKVPSGLIVYDIVGRAAAQSGIKGGGAAAGVAARVEGHALRRAAGVASIHPRFVDVTEQEYAVPRDRQAVLYLWSHIRHPSGDRDEHRKSFGWNPEDIVVLHSGNMGLKQGLDNVVAAAHLASERKLPFRYVLAGDGNQRKRLEIEASGLSTLEFRDPVPSARFPEFLAAADVLLVNERAGVFEMSLPSKLTSYFAAGRPVVAATERRSATAELVEVSGGGLVVPPEDPEALSAQIDALRADPALMDRLGSAGQRFATEQLDESAALVAYTKWVEQLVERWARLPSRIADLPHS